MATLELKNIHASVNGKEILKGVSLEIDTNEVHALMGPNGSGKSTLAFVIMGHPKYEITEGVMLLDGEVFNDWSPDERAKKGLFLSFQYPVEIPGVTVENFMRQAVKEVTGEEQDVLEFHRKFDEKLHNFKVDPTFAKRYLNEGFSGGEKKRMEILQMLMLMPKFAILDETDSGLDVDALKIVAEGINKLRGPEHGALLITHYNRILHYVVPDKVHIFSDGKIIKSGGKELANEIETVGYESLMS